MLVPPKILAEYHVLLPKLYCIMQIVEVDLLLATAFIVADNLTLNPDVRGGGL